MFVPSRVPFLQCPTVGLGLSQRRGGGASDKTRLQYHSGGSQRKNGTKQFRPWSSKFLGDFKLIMLGNIEMIHPPRGGVISGFA